MFKLIQFGESTSFTELICQYFDRESIKPKREVFSNGEVIYSFPTESFFQEDVVVICNIGNNNINNIIMELLILLDLIKENKPNNVSLVLPLIPYSRQDRKFGLNQPLTLRLFSQLLEIVKVDSIFTFDLHSPQSESVFRIPLYNLTAIPFLVANVIEDFKLKDFLFCVPDSGSLKRGINLAKHYNKEISVFFKQRNSQNEISMIGLTNNVSGKDVILIDDMIDQGNTMLQCIKALTSAGVNRIFIVTTHLLLSGKTQDLIEANYEALYTTNTIEQNFIKSEVKIIGVEKIIAKNLEMLVYQKKSPMYYLEDSWFLMEDLK